MQTPDLWTDRPYPRVLHVISSLAVGGTERQLVGFIERCSRPDRHAVAVFDEPGELAARLSDRVVVLGRLGRRLRHAPNAVRIAMDLRGVVRRRSVDLVHAHLGLGELLSGIGTPRAVPLVASRRGRNVGFERPRALKLLEGLGHRRVDLMICNSRFLADHTVASDLWPPPIRVIHNALDPLEFPPAAMPPADPPTVAVVANLHPHKGHGLFLQAFRRVRDRLPDARAVLVGDGPERGRLQGSARQLGLSEAVTFVGAADPRPHVAGSHAVALTSDHEGFPNVLLEAMAMGRPVVATRVGGVPELVRDGVDGFLTASGPQEIAGRIHTLLSDGGMRDRMGAEATARAGEFTWDRVVHETESVYRVLVDPRGGPRP